MKLILFMLFSFFLPFASPGACDTIKIKVVYVIDQGWIGSENANLVSKDLKKYLRATFPVKIKLVSGKIFLPSSGSPETQLEQAKAFSKANGDNKIYNAIHYIFPAFNIGGLLYIGGMSYVCGVNNPERNSSVSNATVTSMSTGQDRLRHSVISAAHEIGHMLGASHVKSNTLMNYQVLGLDLTNIRLSATNANQIKACVD